MLDAPVLTPGRMQPTVTATRWTDWVRFDRRDFGLAFTLAAGVAFIHMSGSVRLLLDRSPLVIAEFVGSMFLENTAQYLVLVALLKAAERLSIPGWRRHLVTMAIGVTASLVLNGLFYFQESSYISAGLKYGIASSPLALLLYNTWQNAAVALIARAWLVKSRDETYAINLLARIRSQQASVRRRLVEGRLQAIQARVDPLFFFDMLDAVQRTYSIDAARAEQLLDELTTFLRTALPRLRTASSSVDQECELARSFARLRVLAGLGTSRLDVDIAPSVGEATFPPGVLLPLVDELLHTTADAGSVTISFVVDAERQTVTLHLTAQQRSSDEALARARATLFDLFGASANIAGSAVDGGARTTVRVPYEPASA